MLAVACSAPAAPLANNYAPVGAKPTTSIMPGASLAGVLLGATRAQVEAVLGKPSSVDTFTDSYYLEYAARGLSFAVENEVVVWGIAYSGRIGGYEKGEFKRFDGHTPEAVTMDSTEDDVRRIYGEPDKHGDLSLAPIPSNWLNYDSRGLTFDFITATHQLISITVLAKESK